MRKREKKGGTASLHQRNQNTNSFLFPSSFLLITPSSDTGKLLFETSYGVEGQLGVLEVASLRHPLLSTNQALFDGTEDFSQIRGCRLVLQKRRRGRKNWISKHARTESHTHTQKTHPVVDSANRIPDPVQPLVSGWARQLATGPTIALLDGSRESMREREDDRLRHYGRSPMAGENRMKSMTRCLLDKSRQLGWRFGRKLRQEQVFV
jgi:hypothetical protein